MTEPPKRRFTRVKEVKEEKPKEFVNKYLNEYQQCFLQPDQYIEELREKGKFPVLQSKSKEGINGPAQEYKPLITTSPERSSYQRRYVSYREASPERRLYREPLSVTKRAASVSNITEDDDEGYYQIYTPIKPLPVYKYYRSSTPDPDRYYRSSTPDTGRYYRSTTPDPARYYRSSTPDTGRYYRSTTPDPDRYYRSSTPVPDRYVRSATPDPYSYSPRHTTVRSLTPEPEMFRYSRTVDPETDYSYSTIPEQLNRYPDIYVNYYSASDTYNPDSQIAYRSSGGGRSGYSGGSSGHRLFSRPFGGISYTGLYRMYRSPASWMN